MGGHNISLGDDNDFRHVVELGYPAAAWTVYKGTPQERDLYHPDGERLWTWSGNTLPEQLLGFDSVNVLRAPVYWTGGASGGPWIMGLDPATGQGSIIGVTSTAPSGRPTTDNDPGQTPHTQSPRFGPSAAELYASVQNRTAPPQPHRIEVRVRNKGAFDAKTTISSDEGVSKSIWPHPVGMTKTRSVDLGDWNIVHVRGQATFGRSTTHRFTVLHDSRLCFEYHGTTLIGYEFRNVDCDTGAILARDDGPGDVSDSFIPGVTVLPFLCTVVGLAGLARLFGRPRRPEDETTDETASNQDAPADDTIDYHEVPQLDDVVSVASSVSTEAGPSSSRQTEPQPLASPILDGVVALPPELVDNLNLAQSGAPGKFTVVLDADAEGDPVLHLTDGRKTKVGKVELINYLNRAPPRVVGRRQIGHDDTGEAVRTREAAIQDRDHPGGEGTQHPPNATKSYRRGRAANPTGGDRRSR